MSKIANRPSNSLTRNEKVALARELFQKAEGRGYQELEDKRLRVLEVRTPDGRSFNAAAVNVNLEVYGRAVQALTDGFFTDSKSSKTIAVIDAPLRPSETDHHLIAGITKPDGHLELFDLAALE